MRQAAAADVEEKYAHSFSRATRLRLIRVNKGRLSMLHNFLRLFRPGKRIGIDAA